MPLFRRHDGDLIHGETAMRRIMPYLMPTRTESLVLNDSAFRIQETRDWLKAFNRAHAERATLFHVLAYAVFLEEGPLKRRALSAVPGVEQTKLKMGSPSFPCSCITERRRARSLCAPIRSATASACVRSIFPLRNARLVNSPACAFRAPPESSVPIISPATSIPP